MQKQLDQVIAAITASANQEDRISPILQTSITRIGAVLLAIFMIQIFLSFYRYFTKLSVYYESRVLALTGIPDDLEKLLSFTERPYPDITFGKEPDTPTEKLIELIDKIRN